MSGYGVPEAQCHAINQGSSDQEALSLSEFRATLSIQHGKYYYGVQIVTGKELGAKTKNRVYLTLVGNKGQTGKVSLHGLLKVVLNPISKKAVENLTIVSDRDLGDILVVIVGNVGFDRGPMQLIDDFWYVSSVGLANLQTDTVEHFPCYHWIGENSSVSITAKTTTLKDVRNEKVLLHQRSSQLKQRQELYHWQKFPETGIPSGILDTGDQKELPADEQFAAVKNFDFTTMSLKSAAGIYAKSLHIKVDDLHDFEEIADALGGKKPLYQAGRWTTDVEFGRQMLNGVNPIIIEKCINVPSNFPITNDMVKPFLVRGLSLEEEMKSGHVYLCDLKIMDGLETRESYYNVAPICLLYVNGSGQLVPIAIQLKQGVKEEEKENNPIFLPSDNWMDWLIAKIYYQSAHSQFHQLFTHYVSCHATMEAFAVGTQRNLPDPHPIFKLLRPHFRYTMAINFNARATLINDGGIIDQFFGIGGPGKMELMKRAGKHYNVHTANIKQYALKREVNNPDQLPDYHYRDDGFKVWDALQEYAGSIINEFYQSDIDVKQDEELQKWAQDIHSNGFPGNFGEPEGHGFPSSISSREQLCEICTLIMFTGSAQHASVNFEQYYYYQFVPNAPFGVRRPPPTTKGKADYQDLLEVLPDKKSAINGVATVHLLSEYSQSEEFLGDFKARFSEKKAAGMIERLKESLKEISSEILQRNKSLDMPYSAMLPERIPNSITI